MTSPQATDWEYHDGVLFPTVASAHTALLAHLQDSFPRESAVLRRAGAGLIVATTFEKTFNGLWGIVAVNQPVGPKFALLIYGDRIALDREASVRIGDDGLSIAAVAFWTRFVGLLGGSLAGSLPSGGSH